jgi:hypothetical protein
VTRREPTRPARSGTAPPTPSTSASVTVAPTPTKPPTTTQNTPVTRPAVTPRSGWQANENLREQTGPAYTATSPKVVFVHHTATTTDYACTDPAKIVRSLYSYHVTSLGWRDLGYNFIVDRCGSIFEGRYGGVDQGVIGAHTYGFNTGSTGISVIGTYTDHSAPLPARQAVAHLAAWELGPAGQSSTSTAQLTEGAGDSVGFTKGKTYTFKAISGHRDGYATECPGKAFYNKLSEIRAWAAVPTNVKVIGVSGAVSASGAYYTKGAVKLTWSNSTPTRLIRSFGVLVDGQSSADLTNLAGTATTASVNVPAGKHTVQVRATHLTGLTAASAALTVNGDTTAPKFVAWPSAAPRTGQVSATASPVTVRWKASDNLALTPVKAAAPTADLRTHHDLQVHLPQARRSQEDHSAGRGPGRERQRFRHHHPHGSAGVGAEGRQGRHGEPLLRVHPVPAGRVVQGADRRKAHRQDRGGRDQRAPERLHRRAGRPAVILAGP